MRKFIKTILVLSALLGIVYPFTLLLDSHPITLNNYGELAPHAIGALVWIFVMGWIWAMYERKRIEKLPTLTDTVTVISKWHETKSTFDGENYGTETSYLMTYEFSDGHHQSFKTHFYKIWNKIEEGQVGIMTYRIDPINDELVFVDFQV